jgi:uncharacterized protein involved in cysteine biosynthesis
MSPTYYVLNFVVTLFVGGAICKYLFKIEPNVGLVIGSILGTIFSMWLLGIKY